MELEGVDLTVTEDLRSAASPSLYGPITKVSEIVKDAYVNIKGQRPLEEVTLSVCEYLGVPGERERVEPKVADILDNTASREVCIFNESVQILLSAAFTQFADFIDSNVGYTDESEICILGGLVSAQTVTDIMESCRVSLSNYYSQCEPLREKEKKVASPAEPSLRSGRRLSSVIPAHFDPEGTDLSGSGFGNALKTGDRGRASLTAVPKRRPSSRVEREGETFEPATDRLIRRCSIQPTCYASDLSTATAAPEEVEAKLSNLTSLQYFDVVTQTLCVLLSIEYEDQITRLTIDGESSGVLRLSEWVTARIIDEIVQDGIDPTLPLDTQLLHCVEGIACEEGTYHWRRLSSLEPEVFEAVWGEDVPSDVLAGVICTKDGITPWFEWGILTKPGWQTPLGDRYTGPRLNPVAYQYRLVSPLVAEALNMNKVTESLPVRTPSFLKARPGASLLQEPPDVVSLTLSAPPEGSAHKGSGKQKPHIRPRDPKECRDLERKYKKKRSKLRQEKALQEQMAMEQEMDKVSQDGPGEKVEKKQQAGVEDDESHDKPSTDNVPPGKCDLTSEDSSRSRGKKNPRCCVVS